VVSQFNSKCERAPLIGSVESAASNILTRFLQMSGMVTGSMIEADRRLRWHEELVRRQKRMAADAEMWRRYQQDYVNEAAEAQLRDSGK